MPSATYIDVDTQAIRFTLDGERLLYLTPYVVQGYIIAFDAGEKIEPFQFQLRDPKRITRRKSAAGKAANKAADQARGAAQKRAKLDTSTKVSDQADDDPREAAGRHTPRPAD